MRGSVIPTHIGISTTNIKHLVGIFCILGKRFDSVSVWQRRTNVKETVTRAIPLPALQLLMLHVLQPPVMKQNSYYALHTETQISAALISKMKILKVMRPHPVNHADFSKSFAFFRFTDITDSYNQL